MRLQAAPADCQLITTSCRRGRPFSSRKDSSPQMGQSGGNYMFYHVFITNIDRLSNKGAKYQ
jgi:hypothetical protein